MRKRFLILAGIALAVSVTACAARRAVVNTWFSVSDYSINIEADSASTRVKLSPTLRVFPKDSTFKGALRLVLRYPTAKERVDLALVSIFSKNEPEAKLPDVKVDVGVLLLDTLIEDKSFDNPLIKEGSWSSGWRYAMKPGQEKLLTVDVPLAAKLVVVRSEIYSEDGKTLLVKYLHGFEIGE